MTQKKNSEIDRRTFLKEVGAGAATLAGTSGLAGTSLPGVTENPQERAPLLARTDRTIYKGEQLRALAMPLGGIGTGSIALAGDGGLRQWQVMHAVNHRAHVPHSFFAFWCQAAHGRSVARVLQSSALYDQSGFKAPATTNDHEVPPESRKLLERLPGVREIEFAGEYPIAQVRYLDTALIAEVSLEAYSPFAPLDSKLSGLPLIVFDFEIKNPTSDILRASLMSTLQNFIGWDGHSEISGVEYFAYGAGQNKVSRVQGMTAIEMVNSRLPEDFYLQGTLALASLAPEATACAQWDSLDELWKDFALDGKLESGGDSHLSAEGRTWNGALAVPVELKPGEQRRVTFILTWHFPNRFVNWGQPALTIPDKRSKFFVGTMYANWFKNAKEVAEYARENYSNLSQVTRTFRDTFYDSSLPYTLLDCVTSQASIIRTPTCIRVQDGNFHGFEGCCGASTGHCNESGCCPLNCTHVWNYEQSLSRLFPDLERTMRHTDLEIQQAPAGYIPHRTILPFYLPRNWDVKIGGPENPALDGMLGTVLKTYRDYRQGAGKEWLVRLWPRVKKLMAYIITTLDNEESGIIQGEQPNTYDTSMYGPNSFMGGLYLAALRASEEMARLVGDAPAAAQYEKIFKNGYTGLPATLWNNEYYIQKVDLEKHAADQYGTGCHSDQLLGQWWARQLDLGYILPKDQVRKTLGSIVRYNWRESFIGFKQAPRVFASDADKGLLVCTWPKGGRPKSPTPYSDEVWTGIEYEVAGLLLQEDMVEDALRILGGIRARYNGSERSPWNDVECGDHYARAMSSWALLEAAAGQRYDSEEGFLAFAPKINPNNFRSFVITTEGWGSFDQRFSSGRQTNSLIAAYGKIKLRTLELSFVGQKIPQELAATLNGKVLQLKETITGKTVRLESAPALELNPGDRLQVEIV
ncbi:MAG TPA: GH116 family glycosyl-hydrolase [Terriglobia bacterium]|nr:GH116 family glycosyl-hydrolase [Terriglobia bacterium]